MNLKTGIGKPGVAFAILIAFAMCVLSVIFHPVETSHVSYGLCLPSPEVWKIPRVGSWAINTAVFAGIVVLLFLLNKTYHFVRTTEPTLIALFLVIGASIPWFTQQLNTSMLLCIANVICLGIIFSSFDTHNATQQMFILGVVVGIGAMFQYAFVPMAVVYFLWALFMKVLRPREILAYLIGIICPYWITIGFGWIRFSDFQAPALIPLFNTSQDHSELIILLVAFGVATIVGFIVTIINSMKLYAGNIKVNAMNLCVSTLGAACAFCAIIDYENLPAYIISLFLACCVQFANICALWNPKMPWTVTAVPSLFYIALFVLSIVF